MKKEIYIQPTMSVVFMASKLMIATSYIQTLGTEEKDGGAALVKEQSKNSYDVWSDDWSR